MLTPQEVIAWKYIWYRLKERHQLQRVVFENFSRIKINFKAWLLNRVHCGPRALWVADQ